jgi:hypothetical protein
MLGNILIFVSKPSSGRRLHEAETGSRLTNGSCAMSLNSNHVVLNTMPNVLVCSRFEFGYLNLKKLFILSKHGRKANIRSTKIANNRHAYNRDVLQSYWTYIRGCLTFIIVYIIFILINTQYIIYNIYISYVPFGSLWAHLTWRAHTLDTLHDLITNMV